MILLLIIIIIKVLGCLIGLRKLNNIKIMQTHISCVGVLPIFKSCAW